MCTQCDFCDFFAGRLIVSHHKDDVAATELIEACLKGSIDHVKYQSNMADELSRRGDLVPDQFMFRHHLLSVPRGQEFWKMNYLRYFYQNAIVKGLLYHTLPNAALAVIGDANSHLLVVPDSALSHSQTASPAVFAFDQATHSQYLTMLGLPYGTSTGAGTTVAIIDTGLDPNAGITAAPDSRNYHDPNGTADISDSNGHGTAVASIVHDVAEDAQIRVLKVGDANPISEWNVMAALLAAQSADVINLSLAYGLPYRDCTACGRQQTGSSRSAVFEQMVGEIRRIRSDAIIVAAAGNRDNGTLDYPSRFGEVVAVGAVDSQFNRASFGNNSGSNYGTKTPTDQDHELVFFAPGGGSGEYVGTTSMGGNNVNLQGTSFAAPFVAGLFALYYGDKANQRDRSSAIDHFVDRASRNPRVVGYTKADHGHGVIQI
jgi:subtilisin family serine protease